MLEQLTPSKVDFGDRVFDNWTALATHSANTYPIGLAEFRPMDRVVVLKPATWGDRVFDELRQCFCWPVEDAAGNEVVLTLPWNGVNESSIEFLEAVRPSIDKLTHVVARLISGPHGTTLEPVSLLGDGNPRNHRVFCPGFDRKFIESKNAGLLEKLRRSSGRTASRRHSAKTMTHRLTTRTLARQVAWLVCCANTNCFSCRSPKLACGAVFRVIAPRSCLGFFATAV